MYLLAASTAAAEAQRWEQAETEHFLFIFEPRDRPSVDELLTFAEDVYAKVSGFFGSYPRKVPCVLRGRLDYANGVTRPFPLRIDLYLTAPSDIFLGARTENWLKVLLTHELTHFVHMTMDSGVFYRLSRLFGEDISSFTLDFLPGWAVEGPAVYGETVFSEGGRGRNPLFEIYSKAAAEEADFYSLPQAGYLSPFAPPSRHYVAGYALVDWLQETYGPDTLRRIMDKYLAFPFFGPWAAIAEVTGKDASFAFADMKKALVARYAPDTAIPGGTPITPQRVGNWSHPQPTARGLYLYRTAPDAFPAIVSWDPSERVETVLVKDYLTDASSFSATADGATIWYSSLHPDYSRPAEQRTSADLSVFTVAGGAARRVTRGARIWHPAVSRDGATLVAVQGVGSYTRLVAVDQGTGSLRVLFSRAEGNVYTPALSPDGGSLAFTFNLRGVQDVYVADLAALEAASVALENPDAPVIDVSVDLSRPVLGPDPYGEYHPSFTDDGRLLFSSDRGGAMSLYTADLASGAVALVQQDPVGAIAAVQDGTEVLYTSYAGTGYCIKSVPLDSLSSRTLVPGEISRQSYPAAVTWTGASVASRPYHDLPAPYLWLPNIALAQTGPDSLDISIGPGAVVEGGSLLGATRWSVDAAWLIAAGQPDGGITMESSIGPLGIMLESRYSYTWSGQYVEAITSSLVLTRTLLDESLGNISRSLSISLGLRHSAELGAPDPFAFTSSPAASTGGWYGSLGLPAGVDYSWRADGGKLDFNPPWARRASLSGVLFLPVLSLSAPQGEADLLLAMNVPSPAPHQVVKLGVKVAVDFGAPRAAYADSFTLPRGFAGARSRSVPGGALATLDYLAPVALLDLPLLFGWGLTGLSVGAHVEGLADFRLVPAGLDVHPVIFPSAEIALRLSFGGAVIPVGVGIAWEVDLRDPGSFDPAADLGIYLFSGFDSFSAGGRPSR